MKHLSISKFKNAFKKMACGFIAAISAFSVIPLLPNTITADAAIFGDEVLAESTSTQSIQLQVNYKYFSKNHKYCLICQSDGNMVVYMFDWYSYERGPAVWHTRTYGHAGNQFYLQKDGNLVVYDSNRNPLWHAKSYGHEQGTKQLCLTDDGELYIKWKKNWYSSSKIFSSYEKGVQITQNDPKLKLVGEYKYDHASLGMRQCDSSSYIKIHYPDGTGKMKVELNYFWSGAQMHTGTGYLLSFEENPNYNGSAEIYYYKLTLVDQTYKPTALRDDSVLLLYCNPDGSKIMCAQQYFKKRD